jgi:hypothetical protein
MRRYAVLARMWARPTLGRGAVWAGNTGRPDKSTSDSPE